ncbi:MAG: adenylate/guanylate cyclase domain-containing protein [Magnetospiraceae bacterium]
MADDPRDLFDNDKMLSSLLDRYRQGDDAERKRLEKMAWDIYGIEEAVFVLDMSGFTKTALHDGIFHFLHLIDVMKRIAVPVIHLKCGAVLKYQADNIFARFVDIPDAVDAALALFRELDKYNQTQEPRFQIDASIGIDYGPLLLLREDDFFGNAMNIASKLGEDMAGKHELLVSRQVRDAMPAELQPRFEEITGHELPAGISVFKWTGPYDVELTPLDDLLLK